MVRSRLDIVENTEIMVGPNQSFYRGTLRPDCRPFRAGIFSRTSRYNISPYLGDKLIISEDILSG